MEFSEAHKYTGPQPVISPSGRYIACAVDARCTVRDAETLTVSQIFSCQDRVSELQWSPDGKHLLCAMHTRGLVQLWNVDDECFACKIDEGPAGVAHACWSSTGAAVLAVADFQLRLGLWDLAAQDCQHRPGPKFSKQGLAWSPDGRHLAVAERNNLKDYVAVYTEGEPDSKAQRFRVATSDLADLAWAPDSSMIAVWDSPLAYNVAIYRRDGTCVGRYQAYNGALGVRCVQWSPDSQLLAIGSYDQVLRVISKITWKEAVVLQHPEKVADEDVVVFEEVRDDVQADGNIPDGDCDSDDETGGQGGYDDQENAGARVRRRRYAVCDKPTTIAWTKPDVSKPDPALGISCAEFSATGRYLASRNDNQKHAVWIWDVQSLCLSCVLAHEEAVSHMAWDPMQDKLAICTGSRRLHVWTPDGASCVHVPLRSMRCQHIAWKRDGSAAILLDNDRFCFGHVLGHSAKAWSV